MAFLIKLVALVAISSLATAKPTTIRPSLSIQPSEESEESESFIPSYALNPPSYESSYQIPTDLQLPKTEQAQVPFYPAELSTALKAPQYSPEPTFYEVPIPSQDLIAPVQAAWNPSNDPSYFYEVPVVLTKQELPTNGFPKKYNKEIHSKTKPFSSKPKQEITLYPIQEKEVARKQKNLNKVFDSLAKKENQKRIQEQQVGSAEPLGAATGFVRGFDSEGVAHHAGSGYNRGLSADLTASLGITSPHSSGSSQGERLEFHMVGHDGPHSYKWGYDTGKGHNRQFRFEERDKEGIVKGHFGFYDKHGKLQMVNYDSHPHEGFHAEGNFGKF